MGDETPLGNVVDTLLLLEDGSEKPVGCLSLSDVENPQEKWPMSTETYVFVSHAGLDKDGGAKIEDHGVKEDIARPTYWFLTKVLKVKAFLDDDSIQWGRDKTQQLIAPANMCTHALVIFSPAYRRRKYCVLELNTFMRRWINGDGIRVLPALFEMESLDGYHVKVSDLAWQRYGGGSLQGASYSDYMIQKLWPALVRELGFDAMSDADLEENLCRYVELHRGKADIPKFLHTFVNRKRGIPEGAESGDTPCMRLGRQAQEPEPNADNPKVIDAYFAIECHKSVSWLHNLTGRSHLLADIDKICDYVEKGGTQNQHLEEHLKNFLSTSYNTCFSDGRASHMKDILNKKLRVRHFFWLAKGVDELHVTSKDFIADVFGSGSSDDDKALAQIDVVVVCMEYGAERIAKAIRETMKNRVGRVIWMPMDPYQDKLYDVFTRALLPFCGISLAGEKSLACAKGGKGFLEACMNKLKIPCDKCSCLPPVGGETATWHSEECPIRPSGKPTVSKQMPSCYTTSWFRSEKLRRLKVAAEDLNFLYPKQEGSSLIDKLAKGTSLYRFFFLVSETTTTADKDWGSHLAMTCRRSRALVLYAINEIETCIHSDHPKWEIDGFQSGYFRVASEEGMKYAQHQLNGHQSRALLWLDFENKQITRLFPSAEKVWDWINSLGDQIELSLVITSDHKNIGHVEKIRQGMVEIEKRENPVLLMNEGEAMVDVGHCKLPRKTAGVQIPVEALVGTIKILPLKSHEPPNQKSTCFLDAIHDRESVGATLEKALFGDTHDRKLCSVTNLYRETDGSVTVDVLIREVKFLTAMRDRGLSGTRILADKLNLSSRMLQFDPNSIASLYESMMLQLETLTDHQQDKLTECMETTKNIHIKGKAGTGKTFLALNNVLDYLVTNNDGQVLFVCCNLSLAFHFCKWLCCRLQAKQRCTVLGRIVVMTTTAEGSPVLYEMAYDAENAILRETEIQIQTSMGFGMIIVDEAHDVFRKDSGKNPNGHALKHNVLELLKHKENQSAKLMLLSDMSQASVPEDHIEYPKRECISVELNEVCRSSKRILFGSRSFQLGEDTQAIPCCAHESEGLPLRALLFPPPHDERDLYKDYANKICKALDDVSLQFRGLDLHHRLAIIVPDESFRNALCRKGGLLLKRLGEEFGLDPITATDASRALPNARKIPGKESHIIVDTVDKMNGLESLIVFGVGLDQRINDPTAATSAPPRVACACIYRAITRAQMFFYLINVEIRGGWLEWLGQLEFQENANSNDSSVFSNDAAVQLVESDEKLRGTKPKRASVWKKMKELLKRDRRSEVVSSASTSAIPRQESGSPVQGDAGFDSGSNNAHRTPNNVWLMSPKDSSVNASGTLPTPSIFDPLSVETVDDSNTVSSRDDDHGNGTVSEEEKEQTILLEACKQGDKNAVVRCLDHGVNINVKDVDGGKPLIYATLNGHEDVVCELLDRGADINAYDLGGRTCLHLVSRDNRAKILYELLDRQADINAKDTNGWTPLHYASQRGHTDVVCELLNRGADVHARDEQRSNTPLHHASESGHKDIVCELLNRGADINTKNFSGSTPLHMAPLRGDKNIVCELLERGADMQATDTEGRTPLHLASAYGDKDVVCELLNHGADIHARDNGGETPLDRARRNFESGIVEELEKRLTNTNAE